MLGGSRRHVAKMQQLRSVMKNIRRTVTSLLTSNKLFIGLVIFFVLEALWIALTGRYPLAFDEAFHLGIIQIYAHHLSPFFTHQPPNADQYGAVFRDPSYLYQYLMSFPYRLITIWTHDQTIEVVLLRLINIALFATCLPLFRKVLRAAGLSKSLVNVLFLAFIFVPVVPLMAAQINYDNLLMPLVAWALLLTIRFAQDLKEHNRINALVLGKLLVVCMLASLVQYEFLPIFLAIVVYSVVLLYKKMRQHTKPWGSFRRSYRLLANSARLTLLVVLVLSGILFLQRYGVNAISYKSPVPDCSKVLNMQRCTSYPPWNRNYLASLTKGDVTRSPVTFTADWFYGMWLRSYFAVGPSTTGYQTHGPLLLPGIGVIVLASGGLLLFLGYSKRIFRHYNGYVLWLFLIVLASYLSILWLDEYRSFLQTGQAVAINGRYLVPLLLPMMALFATGYAELLRGKPRVKVVVAGLAVLCLVWGGGIFTYMVRVNDSWLWRNQAVFDVSHAAQKVLDPIIPGSNNPAAFL
jgi:hypothetical protein